VLFAVKRGVFVPNVTGNVVAWAPRSAIQSARFDQGMILGALVLTFADGSTWQFDVPGVHVNGALQVAAILSLTTVSRGRVATWDGVTLRSTYQDRVVEQRDRLASAARAGDWPAVLSHVRAHPEWVNATRVGGESGYTVLHQAAWHGADAGTVARLVDLGAWRTLRTTAGDRAADIAQHRGHGHLSGLLRPVIRHPVSAGLLADLQRHLHAVIHQRVHHLVTGERLRLPELDPLTELPDPEFWFPVPGMYGGFRYRLVGAGLIVHSWRRTAGGSGQTHRITAQGAELVEAGWG
jgi:hypothetical protein